MNFLDWLVDESPWLIRAPARVLLFALILVVQMLARLVLTESQWDRLDRYFGGRP